MATIGSLDNFRITETATFAKRMSSRVFKNHYDRIREIMYPVLWHNPLSGPSIKRLQGELSSIYRYRIGDYRLFYTVDLKEKLVFILDFDNLQDAYR